MPSFVFINPFVVLDYEPEILREAQIEISRIFSCLNSDEYNGTKEMISLKFKEIRSKLRSGTKYRNVEKLVAIITYFCLKLQNIPINYSQIVKNSIISRKEFNDFYLQVRQYLPKYGDRNRQEYILTRIFEIAWYFNLGIPFYYQAKKILDKLWEQIKNTTDNVIAGLVSSISVLCSLDFKNKVKVSSICDYLDIRMSTIQTQVKKNIFERLKVDSFVSLVKSSGLLAKIFEALGLIDGKIEEEQKETIVELVFGNATEVFNRHDNSDYYFFALQGEDESPIITYVKIYHPLMDFEDTENSKNKNQNQKYLEFNIIKYHKGKDPPVD